ncbi:MAG: ribonuclease D [Alphaproteobacteria bacterium]
MTEENPDPRVIADTDDLAKFCASCAAAPFVTVDTEFLRENTFWAQLCLIQMAVEGDAAIIDPLADGLDLAPFYALMADTSIVKVFHAARQDVEIFVKQSGAVPAPLFDTQVAAMVCGFGDQISYDQLVGRITGERIDKTSRFTDWSRRPLSPRQLDYALSDVTFLRNVYTHLDATLKEQDRHHWVAEEMALLASADTYRTHPEDAWRRLKMRVRKPRQLAVMQALAAWREREAHSRDTPRNRVIKDDAIYEIAMQQPDDREALGRLRAVPRGFERSNMAIGILEAIARAQAIPDADLPTIPRPRSAPEHAGATAELLKVLLKMVAEDHGVASRIVATVDDLEKIASDDDADVAALKGWRRELFGEKALAVKQGRLALAMTDDGVTTVELARFAQAAE